LDAFFVEDFFFDFFFTAMNDKTLPFFNTDEGAYHSIDFTQLVKSFSNGLRVQKIQLLGLSNAFIAIRFFCYPELKELLFLGKNGDLCCLGAQNKQSLPVGVELKKHQIQDYLRAHFQGKRVQLEILEDRNLHFSVLNSTHYFSFSLGKKNKFKFSAAIDEKKSFQSSLDLIDLNSSQMASKKKASSIEDSSREERKYQRLLLKLKKELETAQGELQIFKELLEPCLFFPDKWTSELKIDSDLLKTFSLPFPNNQNRKAALTRLAQLKKRFQKRIQGSQDRFDSVSKNKTKILKKYSTQFLNRQSQKKVIQAKKQSYLKVELSENCFAVVGRNQKENEELFKKARSNDLFFHVRDYPGAHVWVGAQSLKFVKNLPELHQKAALLALFNSKAAHGASVSVSYAKRAELRKVSGSLAKLIFQRSQEIYVQWDDDFYKKVFS